MKNSIWYKSLSALAFSVAVSATAWAGDAPSHSKHAVGSSVNSFGLGVFYTYKLNDQFHVRGTLHGASADEIDTDISGIDYEGEFDTGAIGVLLDWYPLSTSQGWQRNLFVSAGVMSFDLDFNGSAQSGLGQDIVVGGARVSPGELQGLDVTIASDETVPYFGVGWGNKVRGDRGFSFVGEIGVLIADDPTVTLNALDPNGVLTAANIEAERSEILDESSDANGFVSLGISYHF